MKTNIDLTVVIPVDSVADQNFNDLLKFWSATECNEN